MHRRRRAGLCRRARRPPSRATRSTAIGGRADAHVGERDAAYSSTSCSTTVGSSSRYASRTARRATSSSTFAAAQQELTEPGRAVQRVGSTPGRGRRRRCGRRGLAGRAGRPPGRRPRHPRRRAADRRLGAVGRVLAEQARCDRRARRCCAASARSAVTATLDSVTEDGRRFGRIGAKRARVLHRAALRRPRGVAARASRRPGK